jgi:hypothetical protein
VTDSTPETEEQDEQRPQPPPAGPAAQTDGAAGAADAGEDQLSPALERRKIARQRDGEERGDVIAENISDP